MDDAYLRSLIFSINDYDVFSFDVFDTILLRTCNAPDDVFELAGQKLAEQCPEGWRYSPVSYKELRKGAAARAYSKKPQGYECTLDDIFAEMPFSREVVSLIRKLEIECENEVLYLNKNIYSLMLDCAAQGKKIIIISDMYHTKEQILSFLSNAGVDTEIISDLFVSSEYGCTKSGGGELFRIMLSMYPDQKPERVLHIGDNIKGDVEAANKAGIHSLHYNIVPHDFGSHYDFEKYMYNVCLGELTSLRKLAAASHPYEPGSELSAAHAIGAEIIGPVYALFAEWVVQFANSNDINVILPFMREGELLSYLITNVIRERSLDITCAPLFASRRSLFIPSIYAENYENKMSQVLLRSKRTMAMIFDELGLDISTGAWCDKKDLPLESLMESSEISDFEEYLHTDSTKKMVLAHATNQRVLLLQYLAELTGGRPALTVDYAAQGTCCRFLYDIENAETGAPTLKHILMMATRDSTVDHILSRVEIFSWLGIAGENEELISRVYRWSSVLEALICATCGSTLSYGEKGNMVYPDLDPQVVSERQKALTNACWNGVKAFQEYWLTLSSAKKGLCELLFTRKEGFLKVLLRFLETPTEQEAKLLGSFDYSDGYFFDNTLKNLSNSMVSNNMSDAELSAFITMEKKKGALWPQAAVAITSPEYFNRLLFNSLYDDNSYGKMISVLDEIKSKQYTRGVVFGASDIGRKFQKIAKLLKVSFICFVDSNKQLHGANISGLEVKPLNEVPADVEYFVIGSYAYSSEIRKTLLMHYPDPANRPVIFNL